jgi:hypothetical protein
MIWMTGFFLIWKILHLSAYLEGKEFKMLRPHIARKKLLNWLSVGKREVRKNETRVKEYELYVPMITPRGTRQSALKLARLKKRLIARFGGLTYFPQKTQGFWRIGRATFQDEIVILRVISPKNKSTRQFWKKLKTEMQREWQQTYVLVVSREIKTV